MSNVSISPTSFSSLIQEPGEEFFANRALMELVQRIRADETLFAKYVCVSLHDLWYCIWLCCVCAHRYQHSRQLVEALNRFVLHDAEMPEGWEKKLNKEGRVSFHCGNMVCSW